MFWREVAADTYALNVEGAGVLIRNGRWTSLLWVADLKIVKFENGYKLVPRKQTTELY